MVDLLEMIKTITEFRYISYFLFYILALHSQAFVIKETILKILQDKD